VSPAGSNVPLKFSTGKIEDQASGAGQ